MEDVFSCPKFFKIIADPLPTNLRIPPEFMKRHGRNLGNSVFLKVPSSSPRVWWEVDLIRSNAQTLLHKGWKEFSEHYSLGFGHFLLFKYKGNSHFVVLIFDTSASEINYPSQSGSRLLQIEASGTHESDHDSILVLEHLSSSRKQKQIVVQQPVPQTRRIKLEDSSSTDDDRVAKNQTSFPKGASMAYQKALAYAAAPPFFISFMQPSYIEAKFGLELPLSFVKRNMSVCGSRSVSVGIKNDETKVWAMNLYSGRNRARLCSKGWKDFVKDNGLKVGDACIFEVANRFHWNVIVFKV